MPSGTAPRWCIVIAFYNEQDWLARTIGCALAQDHGAFHVILVDNASTDTSAAIAAAAIAGRADATLLHEARPGHTNALRAGFAHAQALGAQNIAFWDADTIYPPDYLTRAEALLGDDPAVIGAMAIDIYGPKSGIGAVWQRWRLHLTSRILWDQGHTGTYGQAFRMAALARAGGPKNDDWPYVLYDHELVHRILKVGRTRYHRDHVCWPSDRRSDNAHVRWTLFERLMYAFTPWAAKDWFFYRWLAPRLKARGMYESGLRIRDWEQ